MALICQTWEFISKSSQKVEIPPDGCQDVIFSVDAKSGETLHIFELANKTQKVEILSGTYLQGFRLNPAAQLDRKLFEKHIVNKCFDNESLETFICEIATIDNNISDALNIIGQTQFTIEKCAKELGVSTRTLQRELLRKTQKSPIFWQQLARARQSAKAAFSTKSLCQVAFDYNYSDQSHFTREMSRWFNKTPAQISKDEEFHKILCAPAYF